VQYGTSQETFCGCNKQKDENISLGFFICHGQNNFRTIQYVATKVSLGVTGVMP